MLSPTTTLISTTHSQRLDIRYIMNYRGTLETLPPFLLQTGPASEDADVFHKHYLVLLLIRWYVFPDH